ncbi:RNA 2',3'-cyclic phosphodiesterase [Candidatus Woesearchaeota archaeon]|nr:RNA 2',3'-cyclic phosphodiesterase [Candidatus Woesearchaeota archaeon]
MTFPKSTSVDWAQSQEATWVSKKVHMRIFIAIDLPNEVKEALIGAQKQLSFAAARMSIVKEFHLTLKFLGEITPAKVEVVKSCLGKVKFKSFSAAVSGIGVFPSESYVRVVWIGIELEEDVIRLQKLIDDALEKEFPKEKGFKPHLTLARVKFISDKNQFAKQLQRIKIKGGRFAVDSFKLKRSTLSNKGAVYEDLAIYTLG